jgi:hypothetical protein
VIFFLTSLTGKSHISKPNGIYPLPGASQQTVEFSQDHLQQHGLFNDENICSLTSLVLGLHRLGIIASP